MTPSASVSAGLLFAKAADVTHDSGVKFTPALGLIICEELASGKSLRRIEKLEGMPSATAVYNWLLEGEAEKAKGEVDSPKAVFLEQYTRAREIQADIYAEETIDIADDGSNDTYIAEGRDSEAMEFTNHDVIARSKLRVEARKWYAGKLRPKKYGDRIIAENENRNLNINTPAAEVAELTDEQLKGINAILKGSANG